MKLTDVISKFSIAITNEENDVLGKMQGVQPLDVYTEREQVVIGNLIRKSLVSKVDHNGVTLVLVNETFQ